MLTFINILYDEIPAKLVQNSFNIFKDYTEKTLFIPESIKEILSNLFSLLKIDSTNLSNSDFLEIIINKNLTEYFDSFIEKLINNWYIVMENTLIFCINQYRINNIIINL